MGLIWAIGIFVAFLVIDTIFAEMNGDGNSGPMWTIVAGFICAGILLCVDVHTAIKITIIAVWVIGISVSRSNKKKEQQFQAEMHEMIQRSIEAAKEDQEFEEFNPNSIRCRFCGGRVDIGEKDDDPYITRLDFYSAICPCCHKVVTRSDYPNICSGKYDCKDPRKQ
ncbi:MAG: hypothetical protein ACI3VJ_01110 [Hominicoprocola sp.]